MILLYFRRRSTQAYWHPDTKHTGNGCHNRQPLPLAFIISQTSYTIYTLPIIWDEPWRWGIWYSWESVPLGAQKNIPNFDFESLRKSIGKVCEVREWDLANAIPLKVPLTLAQVPNLKITRHRRIYPPRCYKWDGMGWEDVNRAPNVVFLIWFSFWYLI